MIATLQDLWGTKEVLDFPQVQGKSNEWYTPAKYVEAAREVMGSIDLDPASCEIANRTVKAKRYFTEKQDGLIQEWRGRIFCNPPYNPTVNCRFPQPTWARKLQYEYKIGNIEAAILLISAAVKQKWFHELLDYPVCFMLERIFFSRPDKEPEELRHGNTVVYFGKDIQAFIFYFSRFGRIVHSIDIPYKPVTSLELWEGNE